MPAIYHDEIQHLKTKDKVVKRCDQLAITYKGDFQYVKDGKTIVEDVKGSAYMITEVFKIKEKMMFAVHGIKIKRVYKPSEALNFAAHASRFNEIKVSLLGAVGQDSYADCIMDSISGKKIDVSHIRVEKGK